MSVIRTPEHVVICYPIFVAKSVILVGLISIVKLYS